MSRSLVALALAVLFPAPLAAQEKDWKWDHQKKWKPTVGYKAFKEADEDAKQSVLVTLNKKTVQKNDTDEKTTYRFTSEVLKVEGDDATEVRYKIEKWNRSDIDGEPDDSLAGKTIVVKGKRTARTWECTDKDAELSDAAKKWIGSQLAKSKKTDDEKSSDDQLDELGFPEKPIADGDEWKRDPAPLAKAFFGEDMEIAPDKSSLTGKLTNVRVEDGIHWGHIELKIVLEVAKGEKFSEGGHIEMTLSAESSLELDKLDSSKTKLALAFKFKNEHEAAQGSVVATVNGETTISGSEGKLVDK